MSPLPDKKYICKQNGGQRNLFGAFLFLELSVNVIMAYQKTSCRRWIMFWNRCKGIGFGFLCLSAPLLFAEQSQSINVKMSEFTDLSPLGQMIDVGGYKLHLYSTGSGGPAVIIDSGLGGISSDWGLVQPEIAKFTQVVSYDRAGIGWSESGPLPRTSQQIVQELHTLLNNAHIPAPYILVGHSFGGGNIQLYAAAYPDEVFGIVLVDSIHEDHEKKLPPHAINDLINSMQSPQDVDFKSTYGVGCFTTQMYLTSMMTSLPESMQNMRSALCTAAKHCYTISAEMSCLAASLEQLANMDRSVIQNKPCIVLAAGCAYDLSKFGATEDQQMSMSGMQKAWQMAWNDLQKDLASKFVGSRYFIAEKSDHMIHWIQPETIVHAVKQLIEENKHEL